MTRKQFEIALVFIVVVFFAYQSLMAPAKSFFYDEGIYSSAGMRLLGGHNDAYGQWFSGSPYLAPILYGIGYNLGDETGARLIAAAFLALAIYGIARATRNLFGESEAVFASLVLAAAPNTLALGHLAVHDVPAISLVSWSFWAITRQAKSENRFWSILAGSFMGIATLTKYPFVVMCMPLMAALIALRGRKSVLDLVAFVLPMASAVGSYSVLVGEEFVKGLSFVGGLTHAESTRPDLLAHHVRMAFWFLPLGLVGLMLAWQRNKRLLSLVLFGSLLIWPTFHIGRNSANSEMKHVVLGFALAAPLCGVALASAWNYKRTLGALLLSAYIVFGVAQVPVYNSYWVDTTPFVQEIKDAIEPGHAVYTNDNNWVLVAPTMKSGDIESPWNIHDDNISKLIPMCDYTAVLIQRRVYESYPLGRLEVTPEKLQQCGFVEKHREMQTYLFMAEKGRVEAIDVEVTLYIKSPKAQLP